MFQLASAEQVECNAQDFALLSAYVLVLLFEIAACEVVVFRWLVGLGV